ncbi:auxin-responsive family protein [Tasmannia lanceolata]|uniref:auxin-responsive family protein n=1 Tax=Tasmannia lanceolata TaxID=3420 RepID=UPI004062C81A
MNRTLKPIFLFSFLISIFLPSLAQNCSTYTFTSNRVFSSCNALPYLNSFLHWTYNPSSGTIQIAYRTGLNSDGWIAWAINPTGAQMPGSQALVGVRQSNGSINAYTTPISNYSPSMSPGNLSFDVPNISVESTSSDLIIFATVVLPNNMTTVNQVWQQGPLSNGVPSAHTPSGPNILSRGTLNFLSGQGTSSGGGNSRTRRRNVHGVLNAVSWGTLMPLGAIIARYMRVFKSADPAWFYLHVACQTSAYIIGVAGWGTGLKLGKDSPGITYHAHRNIGISLFCLATLQVFALLMRPRKDHKYRLHWNIYHHCVGYTVIILSIINIFKGFDILDPAKKWKRTYIGIIIALGAIALVLEAITWPIVLRRQWGSSNKSQPGENGHGATQQATEQL